MNKYVQSVTSATETLFTVVFYKLHRTCFDPRIILKAFAEVFLLLVLQSFDWLALSGVLRLDPQRVSMNKYVQWITSATETLFTVVFYKLHRTCLDPRITLKAFGEVFLLLVLQSFDWLAAFHLELLQAILFIAV